MVLDSFLLGSLLGDGSFVKKSPFHNVYAVFKHSEDQYQYLTWKYEFLRRNGLIGEKSKGIVKVNIKVGSCYENYQNQYRFATKSSEHLNYLKYLDERDILSRIDEDALAVWILDDGSVSAEKVIKISPGIHSVPFCKDVVEKLNSDFGFCTYLYQHPVNPMKNTINFRVRSYEQVKKLILDRVPADIDVVQRKFRTNKTEKLAIKVKYFKEMAPLAYIGGDYASNWIDLRAAEEVEMKQGDFKMIPLGVAMQLPAGYEAHIIPRSSTFKNFGLIQANHMGMIDESYCGDNDQWFFPAIAMRDTVIHAGERICQFRIMEHQPRLGFVAVESLGNVDRGGIGSTGIQ